MMTCGQIVQEMLSAAGKTEDAIPSIDPWEILNEAGHALMNYRDWTWRTVGPVDVRSTAGQDYIELPDDFDAIVSASAVNSTTTRTTIVGLGALVQKQALGSQASSTGWFCAFDTVRPTIAKGQPIGRRCYIWPRPQSAGVPTLRLVYKCRWRQVSKTMDPDTRPNIPDEYQRALVLIARAFLVQRIEQSPMDYAAMERELAALAAADDRRQIEYGPLSGTRLGGGDVASPALTANLVAP